MKILVIGGKRFAGYHIVASALARGHEVVLFNRGKTSPQLYPELETINGDRERDLNLLDGRHYDAVFDTCCYFPRHMRISAEYFNDKTDFYLFVSSISVYDEAIVGPNEDTPTLPPIFDGDSVTNENYGGMKAACECVAREVFGARFAALRPGFICGYRDNSDRMTYWPMKMHYQSAILVPEGDSNFQIIDARDLADFALHLAEQRLGGDFNATGPKTPMLFSRFLDECRRIVNPECRVIRLNSGELERFGLSEPHFSAYFPLFYPGMDSIYSADISKAVRFGLKLRPVAETIRAALDWHLETGVGEDGAAVGLKTSREREIITALNR